MVDARDRHRLRVHGVTHFGHTIVNCSIGEKTKATSKICPTCRYNSQEARDGLKGKWCTPLLSQPTLPWHKYYSVPVCLFFSRLIMMGGSTHTQLAAQFLSFIRNERISDGDAFYGTLPGTPSNVRGSWMFWYDMVIANDGTLLSMFTSRECEIEQVSNYANGGVQQSCADKFYAAAQNAAPLPADGFRFTYTRARLILNFFC